MELIIAGAVLYSHKHSTLKTLEMCDMLDDPEGPKAGNNSEEAVAPDGGISWLVDKSGMIGLPHKQGSREWVDTTTSNYCTLLGYYIFS